MRLLGLVLAAGLAAQETVSVDAGFPGGNIVLEKIEGDTVFLRPDLRDTRGDWFYWHFRVRGAGGRELTFKFTRCNPVGVLGAAASADGGRTWSWTGKDSAQGASAFRYAFAPDARDVRFCVSIPYLEKNLGEFLERHAGNRHLRAETLCVTPKGRKVERLHLGRLDGDPPVRVLFTARHHACEMIASYALEGILEEVLADTEDGRWFRGNAEVLAIPFVDKDGVEDGDQGKNRKPRDHNRDYDGQSVHAPVKAIREFVPRWAGGRLRFALDLHCPTLRGAYNETIYFVGSENPEHWERVTRFSEILESVQSGPLLFRAKDNLPFGKAWNTGKNYGQGMSFKRWAEEIPGIGLSSTLEVSYANANGTTVTADGARRLGRDLARALRRYLEPP